ncbi:GGDEF domain-containing protein [Lactonifactor longoviformis]|uniref:Diguanylate cyclase (GGDEF) domain-containing protein n=1 Tax=Lactonifactor longoviformis DSM 17459 TaxID=1122155 RepID=A0A1M4SBZ9_9CLOT|nr:bifunctional diguanylate cyclase/phosphodiesterase [Lactonifactor longoviformis]POP34412.1 GGDEF domain-containing protein [Lactonifactor longoviformis]SHE29719.1 diguanylate cyclase (GGDEF) domain-containing protein [Lactonifactor longoviformis DSM 17459]
MKKRVKGGILTGIAVLVSFILAFALGNSVKQYIIHMREREAEHILHFYGENIMLLLSENLNETDGLVQMAYVMEDSDTSWFDQAGASLLEREEVRYVCLIQGDTMVQALPREKYGGQVGRSLEDFSYIYTMTKVVKTLVVEGPVELEEAAGKEEVFLFLQPILENNVYMGEVAVALDREFVLEQLGFEYLSEQGYDYELWRVEPQNGGKEVITQFGEKVDFSHAVKTTFYLPTEWNLSIQPQAGWLTSGQRAAVFFGSLAAAFLLLGLFRLLYKLSISSRKLQQAACTDSQTGLYNHSGFTAALDRWMAKEDSTIMLFYFVYEEYNFVSQMMGVEEESAFLCSITPRLQGFIEKPFIAGRLGAGNFMLAVREDMDEIQQEDFARGLSIELLLKAYLEGKKTFLTPRYQYARLLPGKKRAEKEISLLIHAYYSQRNQESPARRMTEKCRHLIEGKNNITFDEYTDPEMTELSKAFNQYRKQVEQLAYFDPVFNVGNRSKYLRDANMLISYDRKRPFSLFCVDICAFSQYNELFSADIGDEILREVIYRLSRPFGTYLYRINGDVFLGISMSGEPEETMAARLQTILAAPASAGNTTFVLRVRIAVCRYPANGESPELLLDRIQSALRYAKGSNQNLVLYSQKLDTIIRTEADILRRLKDAISRHTLEVWYQPMIHVETGRFISAEALVRLPDGKGGYFSAGQVISLAERSGIVEQLGDYVLHQACGFMHSTGEQLGLAHICVNISVQQILVGNSAEHLLDIIRKSGVCRKQITLEITESILIQSIEQASVTLDKLRETGVRIALDDFGVGYSSLNYLSNLPVDIIKIDRSLTQQIRTSTKQHALLHSIVEMAQINSLIVVSEGVETEEEQQLISASGVQYIQGYYYARPMKKEALIHFLEKNNF